MSLIPNEGDRVVCIKDVYSFKLLKIKENDICTIGTSYNNFRNDFVISVYSTHSGYYEHYEFLLDSYGTGKNFFDYFYDLKRYRKIKLDNIIKEC